MAENKQFGNSEQLNDTISRRAAIDKFEPWLKVDGYSGGELNMLKAVLYELRVMPPVQSERKKGRWIEVNDNYNRISGRCSVCGWESHMYEDDVVGMDFCPNCGARLDGEQDG